MARDLARDFVAVNKLKIINLFFAYTDIHKFTWSKRSNQSIIDCITVNVMKYGTPEYSEEVL